MRHARLAVGGLLLVVIALGLRAQPVLGHALLASSDPAANATMATAPPTVTATFTEPPDPRLSSIHVLDASGASRTTGPAVPIAAGSTSMRVPLGPLADGVYTVAWRTVSAIDGHVAAGSFAFSVGVGAPAPAVAPGAGPSESQGSSAISTASILSRWLLYLGLVGLLGAVFVGAVVARRRGRWLIRLAGAAWLLAMGGSILLVAPQASDAGVGVGDLVGTTLGWDAAARGVPLIAAGLLLLAARRTTASQGLLIGLVGGIAALGDHRDPMGPLPQRRDLARRSGRAARGVARSAERGEEQDRQPVQPLGDDRSRGRRDHRGDQGCRRARLAQRTRDDRLWASHHRQDRPPRRAGRAGGDQPLPQRPERGGRPGRPAARRLGGDPRRRRRPALRVSPRQRPATDRHERCLRRIHDAGAGGTRREGP